MTDDRRGASEVLISRPPARWPSVALFVLIGLSQLAIAARLAPEDSLVALLPGGMGALTLFWVGRLVYRKRRSSVCLSPDSIGFVGEDGQAHTYPWDALCAVSSSGPFFLAHLEGEPYARSWGRDWVGAREVAAALRAGSFSLQPAPFVEPSDTRSALALRLGTTLHRLDRLLACLARVAPEARPASLLDPGSPLHEAALRAVSSAEEDWPSLFSGAWASERARQGRYPSLEGQLWVGASSWSVTGVDLQLFLEQASSDWLLSCNLGAQLGGCLARGETPHLDDTTALPSTLTTGAPEDRAEALELVLDGAPHHIALPEASILTVERVPAPDDTTRTDVAVVRLRWEGAWLAMSPTSSERIPGRLDLVAKLWIEL